MQHPTRVAYQTLCLLRRTSDSSPIATNSMLPGSGIPVVWLIQSSKALTRVR
jgi:hypothetical protein